MNYIKDEEEEAQSRSFFLLYGTTGGGLPDLSYFMGFPVFQGHSPVSRRLC